MDRVLQDEVKQIVLDNFNKYNQYLAKNKINQDVDYFDALENVINYSKALQIFQEKYIKGEVDYTYVKLTLKDFINELVNLSVVLNKQQENNIAFTDLALSTKDDSGYVLKQELSNKATPTKLKEIILSIDNKVAIDKLIDKTEKRYTSKFGEFTDSKMMHTILNKEFEETKEYLNFLHSIANIKFRRTNNLTPLIEAVDSMAYEAVQLSAVIKRAERFLLKNNNKLTKKKYEPYYVMMDGIGSKKEVVNNINYVQNLKVDAELLNKALKESDKLDLICNFMTYKQDELHGVFNGKLEDFVEVAKEILKNTPLKMVSSNKDIINIEETPYGVPFELYGPACNECREKMTNPKEQIILSEGNAKTYKQLSEASVEQAPDMS